MRRWTIRELKNRDIADIFLNDGNYPEYEVPIMDAEHFNLGGVVREVEKQRYSLAIAKYQRNMDDLEASKEIILRRK